MNFFSRTKTFYRILTILSVISGIALVFQLISGGFKDIALNPENHIFLFFTIGIFIVLVLLTIALKCVIADAKEDLNAAFNLNNTTDKE